MKFAKIFSLFQTSITAAFLFLPQAQAQDTKLTVFTAPVASHEGIWMADHLGYFKEEGLDVEFKQFPSGTTALQSFNAGAGDITFAGELPAVSYWKNSNKNFRLIGILNRNSDVLVAVSGNDIEKGEDLKGKTIGTRVGSTGSWFISEYLQQHGLSDTDVTIKNLDSQILPVALCGKEIDAYFIWKPFDSQAYKVCPDWAKELSSGRGYVRGYLVLGARADWLEDPANQEATEKFLRAVLRGQEYAANHFDELASHLTGRFGLTEDQVRSDWTSVERRNGFDEEFYDDFCGLGKWMQANDMLDGPLTFGDLIYEDALAAIDPKLVNMPAQDCQ